MDGVRLRVVANAKSLMGIRLRFLPGKGSETRSRSEIRHVRGRFCLGFVPRCAPKRQNGAFCVPAADGRQIVEQSFVVSPVLQRIQRQYLALSNAFCAAVSWGLICANDPFSPAWKFRSCGTPFESGNPSLHSGYPVVCPVCLFDAHFALQHRKIRHMAVLARQTVCPGLGDHPGPSKPEAMQCVIGSRQSAKAANNRANRAPTPAGIP